MAVDFNDSQLERLRSLGIEVGMGSIETDPVGFKRKNNNIMILAGVGLISLGGFGVLMLIKQNTGRVSGVAKNQQINQEMVARVSPSQQTIQKYLLASQQYLSQAIQAQTSHDSEEVANFLDKAIQEASQAIINYPKDFRGYHQRGKIYQSIITSDTKMSAGDKQFFDLAVTDLTNAYKLNNDIADISRDLASLYAKAGDAQKTIYFLSEAIRIEPTKAQNFYDLAKIQSQRGDIVGSLETYKQLIWLVSDAGQKQMLEEEKKSLELILAQNPNLKNYRDSQIDAIPTETIASDGEKIEASKLIGVKIAVAEKTQNMEVSGITDSNALSGIARLKPNQTETDIVNQNVNENCQIYVSVIKGGKNQVLRVRSKSDNSFKVSTDMPVNEEIEFRWWIIN